MALPTASGYSADLSSLPGHPAGKAGVPTVSRGSITKTGTPLAGSGSPPGCSLLPGLLDVLAGA
jgi:hypothetical protein